MNQLTLNAIALSIFAMTFGILLGPWIHLSPWITATATLSILGLVTLDAFKFQSKGLTLTLDTIAQRSAGYRQRIAHHEAGHFLVAHALNLPICGYTLSAWEAFRQGLPSGGVQIDLPETANREWWGQNIEALCTVWVAGAIAEELHYGIVEGATDDYQRLRQTLAQLQLPITQYERQAQHRAKQLLKAAWPEYEKLVSMMQARATVVECRNLLKSPNSQS